MGDKLKDNFWTVERIAEAFQKGLYEIEECGEEIRGKMTSSYITKKLKKILTEMDYPESFFRKSAKKQDGHFIFDNDSRVPTWIYTIFELYDLNRDKIIETSMSDEKKLLEEMLDEIRPDLQRNPDHNRYIEHRKRVNDFTVRQYKKIYKENLFVKADGNGRMLSKCVRANIYNFQVFLVKEWYEKWFYIMSKANSLIINERILNGYRCDLKRNMDDKEKRKRLYLDEYWIDENELKDYLRKDRMDVKEIYNACCDLYYHRSKEVLGKIGTKQKKPYVYKECYEKCVSYIEEIFSHRLREISIENYSYILHKAWAELEDVCTDLRVELELEMEYDNIVYGLKQIRKKVSEDGLKGKKNKRLEKILDEFIQSTAWKYMRNDIDIVEKEIRKIVREEKDDSLIKKKLVNFCDTKIMEYLNQMKFKEDRRLTFSEYKKYYMEEIKQLKIDEKQENLGEVELEEFMRVRIRHVELKKREVLITDHLPLKQQENPEV